MNAGLGRHESDVTKERWVIGYGDRQGAGTKGEVEMGTGGSGLRQVDESFFRPAFGESHMFPEP
jgi:hypothetical protein